LTQPLVPAFLGALAVPFRRAIEEPLPAVGRRMGGLAAALSAFLAVSLSSPGTARAAGTFDAQGTYLPDPAAVAFVDFSVPPERYVPMPADAPCLPVAYTQVTADDALQGSGYVRVEVAADPISGGSCAERFVVHLPTEQATYTASVWMRHGGVDATFVMLYPDGSGPDPIVTARFGPTGRTTSDGWVEMATNEFSYDGTIALVAYLRVADYVSQDGADLDALEVDPGGAPYHLETACGGVYSGDCTGADDVCVFNRCEAGGPTVPPLPDGALIDDMVDVLESLPQEFYGGHVSRGLYLPRAVQTFEQMRSATTGWEFWNGWATGMHQLHDWHTVTYGDFLGYAPTGRLNVCFIEGDADVSQGVWPRDPRFDDLLVAYPGSQDTAGLQTGDRLLAVDGMHPLAWASGLDGVDWGAFIATDPDVYAEYAERLGGPSWNGDALILQFATTFTVLRCDQTTGTCSDTPETIRVADLGIAGSDPDILCDNRPFYHLGANGPDPTKHDVSNTGTVYQGPIEGTTPAEAIYGMTWDDLDETQGAILKSAVATWKTTAHGVILDHRAGNGGIIDVAPILSTLVRPIDEVAVLRLPIPIAGYDGPDTTAEGLAIFAQFMNSTPFTAGAGNFDAALPVALITHRDGSASDFMPFTLQGSALVRLFGPHETAGAFSTFDTFDWWGGLSFQFGSGDTITSAGEAHIGQGVMPDQIVLEKQSDLLAGKDSVFEAALAWVRQEAP
jgi:hypothetical protein